MSAESMEITLEKFQSLVHRHAADILAS